MPSDSERKVQVPELPKGIVLPFHSDFESDGPLNRRWYIADANGKEFTPSASLLNDLMASLTQLQNENKQLITAVWSLLDAGKTAQWSDDIAEANWGINAMAARDLMNETMYAKSINEPTLQEPKP